MLRNCELCALIFLIIQMVGLHKNTNKVIRKVK